MRHKVIHEHGHNFEISSTLITIILLGKFLESFSKKQTVDKLSQLASCKVTKATLVYKKPDNWTEKIVFYDLSLPGAEIDVDLLMVGDVIKVINGQTIPIDGHVVKGSGLVNESMLTGESKPVSKNLESKVFGGTMLTRGSLLVKVDRLAENAAINQIMKLVESA